MLSHNVTFNSDIMVLWKRASERVSFCFLQGDAMKGNKHAQNKRRKQRRLSAVKQDREFCLVDGNYSYYAVAYCYRMRGFLTQGLVDTHRCKERKCYRYVEMAQIDNIEELCREI